MVTAARLRMNDFKRIIKILPAFIYLSSKGPSSFIIIIIIIIIIVIIIIVIIIIIIIIISVISVVCRRKEQINRMIEREYFLPSLSLYTSVLRVGESNFQTLS